LNTQFRISKVGNPRLSAFISGFDFAFFVPFVVMRQVVACIMSQPDASTPLRSAQHDKGWWGKPPPYESVSLCLRAFVAELGSCQSACTKRVGQVVPALPFTG